MTKAWKPPCRESMNHSHISMTLNTQHSHSCKRFDIHTHTDISQQKVDKKDRLQHGGPKGRVYRRCLNVKPKQFENHTALKLL